MQLSLFDYDLPRALIASRPPEVRGDSRMMILSRSARTRRQAKFSDFIELHREGDLVVVNDTRVFPARLLGGQRASGGQVEVFLIRRIDSHVKTSRANGAHQTDSSRFWLAYLRASGRLQAGELILFPDGCAVQLTRVNERGMWEVSFVTVEQERRVIENYGHMPLPPYIDRPDEKSDRERYQTVFAAREKDQAVAAPTAGLHFTDEIIARLNDKGVAIAKITLHVGPGTFKPVTAEDISQHIVDPEYAEISEPAAKAINDTKSRGGRITAVGTTVVRTLESVMTDEFSTIVRPFSGEVSLYIQPGYTFRCVDRLLTNFHLPKSSLLILVSAFAGREFILESYREAVSQGYHFYSYGDCMFIE